MPVNQTARRGVKAAKTPDPGDDKDKQPKTQGNQKPEDAKAAQNQPATTDNEPQEIELAEIKQVMTDVVAEQIKAFYEEHDAKELVTKDDIKTAVEDAFKAREEQDKKTGVPTKDEFKSIAESVIKEKLLDIRIPKKPIHQPAEAEGKSRSHDIEMPLSLTKGNLPLWAKQLVNRLMNKPQDEGCSEEQLLRGAKIGKNLMSRAQVAGRKALTSTGSGTGDELVPTDLASELERRLFLTSDVAAAMMSRQIEMPTNPFELPISTTRPQFFVETTENTAATESTPGTGKLTLTAVKLMAQVNYSYEVDEDAIIAILPELTSLLSDAAADALEDGVINGDSDGTHQDSDTDAVSKHAAKAFDGLRKAALATSGLNVDFSTGGISRDNLIALRKALGKYTRPQSDLFWLAGVQGENDIRNLDEVVTFDKAGRFATFFNREMPLAWGHPILVSERVREDLNASGVFDNTTTTKGSIMLVNFAHFRLGNRRSFTVETDRNIKSQTNEVVASYRKAFAPLEAISTTITPVAMGSNYNS